MCGSSKRRQMEEWAYVERAACSLRPTRQVARVVSQVIAAGSATPTHLGPYGFGRPPAGRLNVSGAELRNLVVGVPVTWVDPNRAKTARHFMSQPICPGQICRRAGRPGLTVGLLIWWGLLTQPLWSQARSSSLAPKWVSRSVGGEGTDLNQGAQ